MGMHSDVLYDPVFQELLRDYEIAVRKLRESVIALRVYHLSHEKAPIHEDVGERWRTARLQNAASECHAKLEEAAAQLLRYGYEIAPHSDCSVHLGDLADRRAAHKERVKRRSGWGKGAEQPRGIEERVHLGDGGPPITIILRPEHHKFVERHRPPVIDTTEGEPAMTPDEGQS